MNLEINYISLILLVLLSIISSTGLEKLSFLQEDESHLFKLGRDINPKVADDVISKTFQENESVYELNTYLELKDNEVFLVMNIKEENNLIEYYIFEGEYQKLVNYDANWKMFVDNTSIFYKLLKKVIPNKNFRINFESLDSFILIQFSINILDEERILKIKLNKKTNKPDDPGHNPDIKSLAAEVANLKVQLENLEKMVQMVGKVQELVVVIPMPFNGEGEYFQMTSSITKQFTLNVSKSGDVKFDFELDYVNHRNNLLAVFASAIDLEINSKTETIPFFNTSLDFNSGGNVLAPLIFQFKKSRSYFLIKGKYNGTIKFYVNPTDRNYPLNCKSMFLRAIQK